MTLLSYQTILTGRVAVVALTGELDVASAGMLESELDRIVADHAPDAIVLDLSDLRFLDSTGLRLVVLADAKATEEGRRFALVRGPDDVHRVFEITRMAERLRILDSAAQAADLGGGAA